MVDLSVVVPAYNEGERIHDTMVEVIRELSLLDLSFELIIVDDGSDDDTFLRVKELESENVHVIGYRGNRGKGYAINYGVKHAMGDLITFIDADMDLHPRQISVLIKFMRRYDADVVVGSKRHPMSELDYPPARRFLSKCYNLWLRAVFGLRLSDTQTGLKLFKKEVLDDVMPRVYARRYAFDVEILAHSHRLGYKIVESPIVLEFQRGSFGRLNIKSIFLIAIDTIIISYRFYIPQYYGHILRDSGIMLLVFLMGVKLYKKYNNPFIYPGLEGRTINVLIVFLVAVVLLNMPFDKIADRIEKEQS